jgi:hypothetical protein
MHGCKRLDYAMQFRPCMMLLEAEISHEEDTDRIAYSI